MICFIWLLTVTILLLQIEPTNAAPLIPAKWISRQFCLQATGPHLSVFNLKPLARSNDSIAALTNITIGSFTGDAIVLANVCQGLQTEPLLASSTGNATVGAIKLSSGDIIRVGGWDNTDWHLADRRGVNESLGVRLTHKAGDSKDCRYDRNGWVLHQEFPCDITAGSVPHIVKSHFYNNPEDGCSIYLSYSPTSAACPILHLDVVSQLFDPHEPRLLGGVLLVLAGIPLCIRGLRMSKAGTFITGLSLFGAVAFGLLAQLAFNDSTHDNYDDSYRGSSGILPQYTVLETLFVVAVSLMTGYIAGEVFVKCIPFLVAMIGAWAGCLLCWVIFDAIMSHMGSESYSGGGGGSNMEHENMMFNPEEDEDKTIAWLMGGPNSDDILKNTIQDSLSTASGGMTRCFLYAGMAILSFIFALLSVESMVPFIIMATALIGAFFIVQGTGNILFAIKGVQPEQSLADLIIESPSGLSGWLVLILLLILFAWGVAVQSKNFDKVLYHTTSLLSPRGNVSSDVHDAAEPNGPQPSSALYHRLDEAR
ncbi:hypothetical protein FOL47_005969 [Perkinsus chesapeaki]|uniref:Uncharacterized protein n=1 Tax=Perkinsus chesapeaki TaxID=330153 RepID=A0A7J6MY78_PERCH|nr:hypothetical protein FOL47_005969 [Perkinsus chesapeaki]